MNEIQKTQEIRLLDVFVFGPFMIYMATKIKNSSDLEQLALVGLGIGTIVYNGINYYEQLK